MRERSSRQMVSVGYAPASEIILYLTVRTLFHDKDVSRSLWHWSACVWIGGCRPPERVFATAFVVVAPATRTFHRRDVRITFHSVGVTCTSLFQSVGVACTSSFQSVGVTYTSSFQSVGVTCTSSFQSVGVTYTSSFHSVGVHDSLVVPFYRVRKVFVRIQTRYWFLSVELVSTTSRCHVNILWNMRLGGGGRVSFLTVLVYLVLMLDRYTVIWLHVLHCFAWVSVYGELLVVKLLVNFVVCDFVVNIWETRQFCPLFVRLDLLVFHWGSFV